METQAYQLAFLVLDWIFYIALVFTVIGVGIEIIHLRILRAIKGLFLSVLSLAFLIAAIGHFLFGLPVEFLFKRYIAEGWHLLPIFYKEYIDPIFKVLKFNK